MDNVRSPTQFSDSFYDTAAEENTSFIIVFKEVTICIFDKGLALEIFFVINKINLHAAGLNGSNFDYQRMIGIINNDVHS